MGYFCILLYLNRGSVEKRLRMSILRLLIMLIIFAGLSLSDSKAQSTAGKQEQPSEKATSVYYNNASLELIITNPFDGNYLVQVFNLTGTEVLRQDVLKTSMARVPASKLKNGVYLVRITPVLNQPSATFKIMVK